MFKFCAELSATKPTYRNDVKFIYKSLNFFSILQGKAVLFAMSTWRGASNVLHFIHREYDLLVPPLSNGVLEQSVGS